MSNEVRSLNVKDIIQTDKALREVERESAPYQDLVNSIKEKGVLNAISVRLTPDGCYELVDGRNRLNAAIDAGMSTIGCTVFANMSESEQLEAQIVANSHRAETKPAAYARQIARLMGLNPMVTAADMSKHLSRSIQWVNQILRLNKLNPEIQELVDSGQMTLINACNLSALPADQQIEWAERAMTETSEKFVPECIARVKEIRDATRAGKPVQEAEFVPTISLRKLSMIKERLDKTGSKDLLWVLSLDEETVSQKRAEWEQKKKEREEEKKAREVVREKARVEAAQKKVDELRMKISSN